MPRTRRRRLEFAWVVATVAYGAGRTVAVAATLRRYGVNPWAYGAIDVTTSVPLGYGTAQGVGAAVRRDWLSARRWAVLAGSAFLAPDLAIVAMGRGMPILVYVALAAVVLSSALLAVRGARRRYRAAVRAARAGPVAARS